MTTRILGACSPGQVRLAVTRDGALLDYAIWRPGAPDGVGDLYRGRVLAKIPAMAGAFVALGATEGFLPDSDGAAGLGVGDRVTVRVTRAAQGGKGPRLVVQNAALETTTGDAPALLARGPGALLELATLCSEANVVLDDAGLAARVKAVLGDRVSLAASAFDEAIEEQTQALGETTAELPTGARLHIEPTSALVAIDVDAGASVGARQGKTALHLAANRAVVPELTRQIRLRNLSGAILVDFAGSHRAGVRHSDLP